MTKKNRYPITLIQEIMARLVGIRYFTRFDLVAAFNNLRMHPDSQGYITFKTVKICGNPDESRWNSLDPSGCSLAKVAGAEALAR